MSKHILVIVMAVIVLVSGSAFGQEVDVSGYGVMDIYSPSQENYAIKNARVRLEVKNLIDSVGSRIELDFSSKKVSYLYVKRNYKSLSVILGKGLGPIGKLYDGSSTLKTIRWVHGFDGFDVYGLGAHFIHKNDYFIANLTDANEGRYASVTNGTFSWFWQQDVGYGFILKDFSNGSLSSRFITSFKENGQEQFSLSNYSKITSKIGFNTLIDWGEVDSYSTGFTYEWVKKSFVKWYVNWDRYERPTYHTQMTIVF